MITLQVVGRNWFKNKIVNANVNKHCAVFIKVIIMWVSIKILDKWEKLYKVDPKLIKLTKCWHKTRWL